MNKKCELKAVGLVLRSVIFSLGLKRFGKDIIIPPIPLPSCNFSLPQNDNAILFNFVQTYQERLRMLRVVKLNFTMLKHSIRQNKYF